MAPTSKLNHREFGAQPEQPELKRPKNLLKRLSSGLSSILPTISWPKWKMNKHLARPITAPVAGRGIPYTVAHDNSRLPVSQQIPAPHIDIPQLSEPEYCSYDPYTYHSFPSIEPTRCDFCGLCPPPGATSAVDEPCIHCRTRSPISHLTAGFRHPFGQTRSASAIPNNLVQLIADSPASEQGPRLVSPSTALTRINNPPRTSPLPGTLVPSHARLHLPSTSSSPSSRPRSPRLHHLSLVPGAQSHPYVHRHEVAAHLAAIRAGAPSPLRHSIDEAQHTEARRATGEYHDFSRTVFYGTTTTSARTRRADTGDVVREVHTSGMVRVQSWSRHGWSGDADADADAPVVNGVRLELRGGSAAPRLRGGGSPYLEGEGWRRTSEGIADVDARHGPRLRGGAGERVRVPAALYWLAGGTGRAVTMSSWNKEKGKKRLGGLLGRVMYGAKSGREYEIRGERSGGSVESGRATLGEGSVRSVHVSVKERGDIGAGEGRPADVGMPETPVERLREAGVQADKGVQETVQENVSHAANEDADEAAKSSAS